MNETIGQENTQTTQAAKPAKLLPKDTNAAVRAVLAVTETMSKLFAEETEALINIDNATFLKLQERKLDAAQDYQNVMSQMMARKNELAHADPALKQKLKEMQGEFSEISDKNLDALGRMQRCTEKLGNTIRSAAIKEAQKGRGYSYGEDGSISKVSKKKAVSSGLSETA